MQQIHALANRTDGPGLLEYARLLRSGVQVDADNPLAVPDYFKARKMAEAALTVQGTHTAEAKLTLGKMLLASEGGAYDGDRALRLLQDSASTGQAEAAYLVGNTLAANPGRLADARRNLQLAMRLGFGAAAFKLSALSQSEAERSALNSFGITLLEKRFATSDARSGYELGEYYRRQAQSDEALKLALDWYRKASDLGHERSTYWMARLQSEPGTGLFNPKEAVRYYEIAAEAGDIAAAREIVRGFAEANGLEVDKAKFDRWVRYLAQINDSTAILYFSSQLERSLLERQKISDAIFTRVAKGEIRDIDEILRIGEMFDAGNGVIGSAARALQLYQMAVERKSRDGAVRFGELLIAQPALRTDENVALARLRLEEFANNGSVNSAVVIGDMTLKGMGVPASTAKAVEWYQKAQTVTSSVRVMNRIANAYLLSTDPAEQRKAVGFLESATAANSDAAMLKLAKVLSQGTLVPQNLERAVELLTAASERGRTDSLSELANLYIVIGGPDSLQNAYTTFAKAVATGNPEAPVEMARFLQSYGKMKDAIPFLKKAAKGGSFSAAIDLYETLSAESGDANTGIEWLQMATDLVGETRQNRFLLAKALLRPNDKLLNLQGFSILQEMVTGKVPGAVNALAAAYIEGRVVAQDVHRAVQVLETAMNQGDIDAVLMLADLYLEGTEVPSDPDKALTYYRKVLSIEPENASVNLRLAQIFGDGIGVPADKAKAVPYYQIASAAGSRAAQRELGLVYMWGAGVPSDPDRAHQLLLEAASQGFDRAWHDLSLLNSAGIGSDIDPQAAFQYNYKGAERGQTASMIQLGIAFLAGFGVPKDPEAGIFWLERAAETPGEFGPGAMYRLYEAYHLGLGVEKDQSLAQSWLKKARDAGNPSAMFQTALVLRASANSSEQADGLMWMKKAQSLKHNQSNKILTRLALGPAARPVVGQQTLSDEADEE
ncbi:tetratricopeptide repeat protein [Pararhizobium antarcticum]|uniref:Uncharacterized protein n=1 Tax=Pararhizobium antarcticum TaxID=1798805 RepID=A0A657LN75_9HYPH|nr:SEL1-like repeat protein [Pararhizobium antarcticum]OJF91669.1 hypothetical protein AX760_23170 [Pararhizobium antarcticum]OJF96123.1 hypothetical protein AX761_16305 [Rhizobium sp. 58]